MKTNKNLQDYTEAEFLELLQGFFEPDQNLTGRALDKFHYELIQEFNRLTEHPEKSDLIYWPKDGNDVSPASILKTVKEWRAQNGKPGFKPG